MLFTGTENYQPERDQLHASVKTTFSNYKHKPKLITRGEWRVRFWFLSVE